jgi:allantoinase
MALTDRIPYQAIVDRPKLTLPDGKRIAVWVILNVEEWRIEGPMPRTVLPPPMGQPLLPDVPNWSWHEYGMRAGFWRQHAALTSRGIPVTMAINGNVCRSYPRVAGAGLEAGWEFMGHGFLQGPMHRLPDQRKAIHDAVEAIEAFTGTAPAQLGKPRPDRDGGDARPPARGGDRVCRRLGDRRPAAGHRDAARPVTTIPYTVEVNDITVYALQQHESEVFFTRGKRQFDRLYAEGATNARVMAISIHPYITGVPHRIGALEDLLDYIGGHDGVAWMTASEIGDWYRGQIG